MENKPKLIIVEGPQGTGKTTVSNYLREVITYSNLYRLSGHRFKGFRGQKESENMYKALFEYIDKVHESEMSLIFDRIFISEVVYCNLGYRDYSIGYLFDEWVRWLGYLESKYEVFIISLYVENDKVMSNRLKRDKPLHLGIDFSVKQYRKQYQEYEKVVSQINKEVNVRYIPLNTEKDWEKQLRETFLS